MKKGKKTLLLLIFLIFVSACGHTVSLAATTSSDTSSQTGTGGSFKYTMLESIPGFFSAGTEAPADIKVFITGIYKFGLWTIGIAALFMIVVGGFMYMGSAGNNSTAGDAKKVITDALWGVAGAFCAWLFLYIINPDLTKIILGITPVSTEQFVTEGTPLGSGICATVQSGSCSVDNLKAFYKNAGQTTDDEKALIWATQASSICNIESGGNVSTKKNPDMASGSDYCMGNGQKEPVSFGLMQINISANPIDGLPCKDAFNRSYGKEVVNNKTLCWVTNQTLYSQCVTAAKDPNKNLKAALNIYNGAGKSWKRWGANQKCLFP